MTARAEPTFVWLEDRESWAEVAAFFARLISLDPAYISHGEIQAGLSLDGASWVSNLEERFLAELGEFDGTRSIVIARDREGELLAAANVTWSFDSPDAPFATIEDMVVDPKARSRGLGRRLYAAVETEARQRGVTWIFLESGTNNTRAHAFFERLGMVEVSRVFAARL